MYQISADSQNETHALGKLIQQFTSADGTHQLPLPGVRLMRSSQPNRQLVHGVATAGLCLVGQGAKSVHFGQHIYDYNEDTMLVYSIDVPVASQIKRASRSAPFLCMMLDITPERIGKLTTTAFPEGLPAIQDNGAVFTAESDPDITGAAVRLLRLMSKPRDMAYLAPILTDEIFMRLLRGPLGPKIARITHLNSPGNRINKAVSWLRDNFTRPVTVDELANVVNMSPSTFHHHFKTVTSMSPIQYQKTLRLQEARRLMLTSGRDVNSISHAVGYVSPSQFIREYSRLFGETPRRDLERLLEGASLQ